MKIALNWIAEYLDRPVGAEEAAEALLNAGLPIESIEQAGDTQVLDVEVTSNRTDCLSHIGVARELAALLGRTLKVPTPAVKEGAAPSPAQVAIEDPAGCSYYSARVIAGVKVAPSPAWLAARLESIGLRPVNNVVDVTNYVMMECGQPLHAFDYAGLAEKRIVVRRARQGAGGAGEKMQAINGSTYELSPANLVIADAVRPVAIAGVMGGKETEVDAHTTTVLLESARFDPLVIRATARQLALMSDSSYRFERGIDPAAAEWASRRAAQMIVEIAGGTVGGVVAAGIVAAASRDVALRLRRLAEVLGIDVPAETVVRILAGLGFSPRLEGGGASSAAPCPATGWTWSARSTSSRKSRAFTATPTCPCMTM